MPEVLVAGEALVEIMRPGTDLPLDEAGPFTGPYPSGAPAIAADALGLLGRRVGFIGAVGEDDFGRCVITRLAADGVDVRYLREIPDATTAIAFVTYFRDGRRRFLFHLRESAAVRLTTDDIDEAYLGDVAYLHLSGSTVAISDALHGQCLQLTDRVLARGGRLSFDPNFRPELLPAEEARDAFAPFVQRAAVLLPGVTEASWLTGEADPLAAAWTLLARGPSLVVLKRGPAGATALTSAGRVDAPGFPVEEVDPTGAGDCFAAALLSALIDGRDLRTALRGATAAGALAVGRRGPMEGSPTRAALESFLAERGGSPRAQTEEETEG